MNYGMIIYVIGRILGIEALLLTAPLIVSIIYHERAGNVLSFAGVILLLFILERIASYNRPKNMKFYAKEGLVMVSLTWLALSFFGALPFVFSGEIPSLADAFFETASGFTTTGSSILTDVEALSHSMKFWRSFTHLIGGMGVLVFALAVLPATGSESVHIMKAEVPGPVFGKLVSKLKQSAMILYAIYLAMTAVVVVLLLFGGMDLFDALLHAFGAAGTGGFGLYNNSIAHFGSSYIHNVLAVSMLAFGINFNLYYMILIGQAARALKSEELRWYLGIMVSAVILICINVAGMYDSFGIMLRDVFFTVSSIITTTGYSTADFGKWPLFSHIVLLMLMFFGACAGSTAGGLKISRVGILVKTAFAENLRIREPKRAVIVRFENKALMTEEIRSIAHYFVVYVALFIVFLLLISPACPDFLTAFSTVTAAFNNIGPGLGAVGPAYNFGFFPDYAKVVLSVAMFAGRLEIYPVIMLFMPSTWRKHI